MRYSLTVLLCFLTAFSITACVAIDVDSAIRRYNQNAGKVQLEMSEQEVRGILGDPGPAGYIYPAERTTLDGAPVTILYYRTARIPDGLTTDDEMTPLLFVEDRLRAIGWTALKVYASRPEQSVPEKSPDTRTAGGTCFVVHPNGLLLTAYHVVSEAKSIRAHFENGMVTTAKVQTFAASNDLAILRIDRRTPHFLPLAPSGSVRVGDQVFTMGYPVAEILGQEPKFTDGSISALSGVGGEASLLQISVPVQPGNSGGPLVNERGEVVGILTSTAAVRTFLAVTGTLPQNVNWAVKTEYARLLFDVPTVKSVGVSREEAVQRVRRAICRIEAISR